MKRKFKKPKPENGPIELNSILGPLIERPVIYPRNRMKEVNSSVSLKLNAHSSNYYLINPLPQTHQTELLGKILGNIREIKR